MIKYWKNGVVIAMATMLIASGINGTAHAANKNFSRNQLYTSKTAIAYNQKQEEKELFKEGEVIILYGDESKKVKAFAANALGNDLEVEETYSFDVNKVDKSLTKAVGNNSNTTGTLHFSLVKSDKYTTKQLMEMMKKRSDVKAVAPNFKIKALSTDYSRFQWANQAPDENGGGINSQVINKAIKSSENNGKEKVIAIVDTGVDYTHPDLADKMWNNPYNNIEGEHGYNFVDFNGNVMDDAGHGTHCAGIAAGNYDDNGISGVVDSDNVKIMALKLLDEEGGGYFMGEIGCYNYIYRAQQLGTNVVAINNSWGTELTPNELENMPEYEWADLVNCENMFKELADLTGKKGAISCVAAGNSCMDNNDIYSYPANVDSDYVVTVAASNENDELAWFSNYGSDCVDLAAPGTNILSSVCYENFEPSILSEERVKETCAYFDNFENKTDEDLSKDASKDSISFDWKNVKVFNAQESDVSISTQEHFGKEGKSIAIRLSGVEKDGKYYVSIPFKAPSESFDYAYKMKLVGNGELENYMSLSEPVDYVYPSIEAADFDETLLPKNTTWATPANVGWSSEGNEYQAEEGEELRMVFEINAVGSEDIVLHLDDVAVSKSTDEEFEKYAYYEGTSMATPAVTGAVAALAELYPEMDALERKQLLLSCVRPGNGDSDYYTATGGILDLSNYNNPNANVKSIELKDNKNIVIEGSNLDGATVTINDEEVEATTQTANSIVIDATKYLNTIAVIVVTKNGKEDIERLNLLTGKELTKEEILMDEFNFDDCAGISSRTSSAVSDGSNVYVIAQDAAVYKIDDKAKKMTKVSEGIRPDLLGEGYEASVVRGKKLYIDNNCVSLNGALYAVATLDTDFEETRVLVRFTEKNGWEKVSDVPETLMVVDGSTVGAYNGTLYLLGGINNKTNEILSDVYCFDPKAEKWTQSVSLPENRFFARAVQVDNQLLLVGGAKEIHGQCPETLIFDGEKWSVSKQKLDAESNLCHITNLDVLEDFDLEDGFIDVYLFNPVATKDGVILSGAMVPGMGNLNVYDVKKDEYRVTGYKGVCGMFNGITALGDKLYLVGADTEIIGMLEDLSEDSFATTIGVYSMPIKSSMVQLSVTGNEYVDIIQSQKEWYLSDDVTFQLKAKKDCELTSVTINGKEVKPNKDNVYEYSAPASQTMDGVKVEVKGRSTKKDDSKPATTETKKPTTTETNATDTANKKELPKKNSKVKVGKLTYKVTNAEAVNGTVSCVKMNNKNLTKISVPDTVEINGYTFKVTKIANGAFASSKKLKSITIGANVASIGKNVCKSCKKLNKITIKSERIKSFGKGTFKGINKKAVIKVPKKVKKTYAKKLKKAGCKATVK